MSRRRNHPGQLLRAELEARRNECNLAESESATVKGTDSLSQLADLAS